MPVLGDQGVTNIDDAPKPKKVGKPQPAPARRRVAPSGEPQGYITKIVPPTGLTDVSASQLMAGHPPADVKVRSLHYSMKSMEDAPDLVGYLMTADHITDRESEVIGQGLEATTAWLNHRDELAGLPGFLTVPRLRALDIPQDTEDGIRERAYAKYILNAMHDLPPDEQQAMMALMQGVNPEYQAAGPAVRGVGVDVNIAIRGEDVMAHILNTIDKYLANDIKASVNDDGELTIRDDPENALLLKALKTLFPELEVGTGVPWYEGVGRYVYDKSPSVRNILSTADAYNRGDVSYRTAFLTTWASTLTAGFDLWTGAAGSVGRKFVPGITEAIAEEAKGAQEIIGAQFTKIVAVGLDPDDPDYEEKLQQRAAVMGILLTVAGPVVGKVASKIKIARGAVGTAGAEAALNSTLSVVRSGALGAAEEVLKMPVREVSKMVNKLAVHFARDPEAWWKSAIHGGFRGKMFHPLNRSTQGKRMIEIMEAAKKAHPGDLDGQVGFVQEGFGTVRGLSDKLARKMLKQTSPDGMKRAFVEHLTAPAGKEAIAALRTTRRMLESQVREAVAARAKAEVAREVVAEPKKLTKSTLGEIGVDNGEYVFSLHAPENHAPIAASGGLDPAKAKAGSFGVHFSEDPYSAVKYADSATGQGIQGAEFVIYRVRKDALPDLQVVEPRTDLFTRSKVDAQIMEVWTGAEKGWQPVKSGAAAIDTEAARAAEDILRTRLRDVNDKLSNTMDTDPIITYPVRSTIRAAVRAPATRSERLLSHIVKPGSAWDVAKAVDELPKTPILYVPGSRFPADGVRRNIDTISNYLRRVGVKPSVTQKRIGELGRTRGNREFFDLVEHKIFGENGDVAKALDARGGVPPELRDSLIFLHNKPVEGRTHSFIYRAAQTVEAVNKALDDATLRVPRPIVGHEVRPGEFIPRPSRPTEFLNEIRLPDVDLAIEATSALRRIERMAKTHGIVGKGAAGLVFDVPKLIMDVGRLTLKPLVMAVRLPAMGLRIQMEQAARLNMFGYRGLDLPNGLALFPGGIPVPKFHAEAVAQRLFGIGRKGPTLTVNRVGGRVFGDEGWKILGPDPRLKGFTEPNFTDMGAIMSEVADRGNPLMVPKTTLEFRTGHRIPKSQDYEAWRAELEQAHLDFVDNKIAATDFDRQAVKDFLGGDENAARYMSEQQGPILVEEGMTVDQWLDARIEYVKQLTRENPDFVSAIATGKLRSSRFKASAVDSDGRAVVDKLQEQQAKIALIEEDLKIRNRTGRPEGVAEGELDPATNVAEMIALQAERLRALRKVERLREKHPNVSIDQRVKSLADKSEARAILRDHWEASEWEMPDVLNVNHRTLGINLDGGLGHDIRQVGNGISTALYKPFKALNWVDKKGTRGSLYRQAFTRESAKLEARGYKGAELTALARARAGEITRDIMYDLTARTSVQRALQGIFWFAPAFQEVLYTWLVKGPSQSYWLPGAAAMVAKYQIAKATLREVGLLQKDSRGEEVLVIPGLAPAVEKIANLIPGVDIRIPDKSIGALSGLNLVTSGGVFPGLSTPANFALGQAALHYGGIFKQASDILQPYGPETTLLPAPITYAYEAAFGEPPPWEPMSPGLQKSRWDQSMDVGIQYAYGELKANGKLPPLPEDFGTKDAEGSWTLTPEQEVAYKKASTTYLHELMTLGKKYAMGNALFRLGSSTVAPMSLYATSDEEEAWKTFWNQVVVPEGFGETGLSDEQRDLIDSYIGDHPESAAFSVYYKTYGEKERVLPFAQELDDKFYDSYLTGESRVMDPKSYSYKLMAIDSMRHYQGRLDAALNEISPGRDPWALLTQGYKRNLALQEQKEEWDRYLFLNQHAAAVLTETKANWIEAKKMPVRSFEAERLANTIDSLKQLSGMITGEAKYRPEELRTVLADLQELYSDRGEFGEPNTPTEKAMGWWFDNVMDPYFEKTDALYQQAELLQSYGLSPASVYNQIRAIQNQIPPKYKGKSVPSVEEVFWGNKSPEEQKGTLLKWETQPLSWQSDFRLDKVYDFSEATKDFLGAISNYDQELNDYIARNNISYASNDYETLQQNRLAALRAAAKKAGPEAEKALAMNEAPPYVRLGSTGFGDGNGTWKSTVSAVQSITSQLVAKGLSPRGLGSADAQKLKLALFKSIEAARDASPEYDQLWKDLSSVMLLPNGVPRDGALLYEPVLFGSFYAEHIPYEFATLGLEG